MSDPASLIPLRPVIFEILLLLNQSPCHGYGLMKALRDRPAGRWIPGPGTLYRTLREMQIQGLIESEPAINGDRRREYRLTILGRQVAVAETRRMETLIRIARAGSLLTDG